MPTRSFRAALAFGAFTLLSLANTANAQTYAFFPNDTTINSTVSVTDAIVGYANNSDFSANPRLNPTSPNVKIVTGANVGTDMHVYNKGVVNMSGGTISHFLASTDNSVINLSGGQIGILDVSANGTFNLTGGRITTYLSVENTGTLNIFGTNLSANLVNANYFGSSYYNLSGTLLDGNTYSNIALTIQNGTGASFHLNPTATPAPSSLLVVLGGIFPSVLLLRKRRK